MFKKLSKILLVTVIAVTLLGTTVFAGPNPGGFLGTEIDHGTSPTDYELDVQTYVVGLGSVSASTSGAPNTDAAYPEEVYLTPSASAGNHFVGWTVGSIQHYDSDNNTNNYSVGTSNMAGDVLKVYLVRNGEDFNDTNERPDGYVEITAVFAPNTVTMTTGVDYGNGTALVTGTDINGDPVSSDTSIVVAYGTSVTFTATPIGFWDQFGGWNDAGGNYVTSTNPNTFTAISDTTLLATFYNEGPEMYYVFTAPNIIGRGTTQIQDTLGNVINGPDASGAANTMVEYGDSVVCIATPAAGHFFKKWIDASTLATVSTSPSVTVSDYADLIAVFDTNPNDDPDEVNVSSRPNFADRGTTSPTSTSVVVGSSVVLTAVEAVGYDFVEWTTEGGTQVSTSPSFTYTANTAGSFIAVFEPEEEDVPEEPEIPEDVPEEPEDIPEEPVIPEATPEMPETAGIPLEVASLFGGSLVALGTVLKKKRTK